MALTYYVTGDIDGLNDEEWAHWREVAFDATNVPAWVPRQFKDMDGGTFTFSRLDDTCAIARYLLTMHDLVARHGQDFLRDWVNLMWTRHPMGSPQPVDAEIWHLVTELVGEEPALYATTCSSPVFRE